MEQYIKNNKSVSLDTLCSVFDVSKNTVRRDVNEIVSRTNIKKIYGGVSIENNIIPPPFSERFVINQEVKSLIGKSAATLVDDGDVIYIDSGTTTCHIVDFLQNKKNVTVLTHSLDVINRAVRFPNLEVISLSGILNRKTLSFTGQSTIDALENCNISKTFMAANGITIANGATQSTSIEFAIKKNVVAHSDMIYLMVENKKFGAVSLFTYCKIDEIDAIITEKLPSNEFVDAFSAVGGIILTPE
jgi:DeoR family myo-inositol catabolism operon transcriptional repressor